MENLLIKTKMNKSCNPYEYENDLERNNIYNIRYLQEMGKRAESLDTLTKNGVISDLDELDGYKSSTSCLSDKQFNNKSKNSFFFKNKENMIKEKINKNELIPKFDSKKLYRVYPVLNSVTIDLNKQTSNSIVNSSRKKGAITNSYANKINKKK
jgi:hypothetical protein